MSMADALRKAGFDVKDISELSDTEDYSDVGGRKAVNAFMKATPDNPMFAVVELQHLDFEDDETYKPVWRGLAVCTGVRNVEIEEDFGYTRRDRHVSFRAIEPGTVLGKVPGFGDIKQSHGFHGDSHNFIIKEMLEPTPELMKQYRDCIESIKVSVRFRDYDYEVGGWLKSASELEGTEVSMDVPGAHSLDDGYRWMLMNHPGQIQGMSISTSSGDFFASAIPCEEYGKGMYETREGREAYARMEAEKYGVELGAFDYALADKAIEARNQRNASKSLPRREKSASVRGGEHVVTGGMAAESEMTVG